MIFTKIVSYINYIACLQYTLFTDNYSEYTVKVLQMLELSVFRPDVTFDMFLFRANAQLYDKTF